MAHLSAAAAAAASTTSWTAARYTLSIRLGRSGKEEEEEEEEERRGSGWWMFAVVQGNRRSDKRMDAASNAMVDVCKDKVENVWRWGAQVGPRNERKKNKKIHK